MLTHPSTLCSPAQDGALRFVHDLLVIEPHVAAASAIADRLAAAHFAYPYPNPNPTPYPNPNPNPNSNPNPNLTLTPTQP